MRYGQHLRVHMLNMQCYMCYTCKRYIHKYDMTYAYITYSYVRAPSLACMTHTYFVCICYICICYICICVCYICICVCYTRNRWGFECDICRCSKYYSATAGRFAPPRAAKGIFISICYVCARICQVHIYYTYAIFSRTVGYIHICDTCISYVQVKHIY